MRVESILDDAPERVAERDESGRSLLWWAALEGYNGRTRRYVSLVRVLLDAGAEPDVVDAVVLEQPAYLQELLADRPDQVGVVDSEGMTPLHHAAARGAASCAGALLRVGADPRAKDGVGNTAMDLAVEDGPWRVGPAIDVARLLVEHGCELTLPQALALDDAALMQRVLAADPEGVQRLDLRGSPPLVSAAAAARLVAVQALIEAGAQVDARGRFGRSALVEAASRLGERDTRAVIHHLCSCGADRTLRDGRGWSAADYAAALGDVGLARWLANEQASKKF